MYTVPAVLPNLAQHSSVTGVDTPEGKGRGFDSAINSLFAVTAVVQSLSSAGCRCSAKYCCLVHTIPAL